MGRHFSLASALVHQLELDSCAGDKAESFNSALSSEYCSAIRILLWSTQRHREGGETHSFFSHSRERESTLESRRERRRTRQRESDLSLVNERFYGAVSALMPPFTPSLDSHHQLLTENYKDNWKVCRKNPEAFVVWERVYEDRTRSYLRKEMR